MNENVRLLMEEIGCEQGEAELALELANNDLENAIKTIENILRHIFALKGKFYFAKKNLYGLLVIVINTKTQEILRLRTVVSYNPAVYENSPKMDWYALEKLIYSSRLDEGSLPDFTQSIEQRLHDYIKANISTFIRADINTLQNIFIEFLKPDEVTAEFDIEELNLGQFRKLPENGRIQNERVVTHSKDQGAVCLNIDIVDDPDGKEANALTEGDVVLSVITDDRDIAHYLAHLIGSKKNDSMIPTPAVVRKVAVNSIDSEVHVQFSQGITGIAHVKNDKKVKVLEGKTQPWWKKIVPW